MKNKKLKLIHIGILSFLYFLMIILITKGSFYFGSTTDYLKQHVIFPEYFRNLFYETGMLLPNFAPHLGGGQNIFYFIYYGYLNPVILLSYLMPFISMKTYILGSTILLTYLSILLMYHFLEKNGFNKKLCFIGTTFFLLASPLLYHSHRHIMFINYMPFLLLGLLGVKKYFESKKSTLLILSTFLMILTSFYYSITGIITLSLYALYEYLKKEKEIHVKTLLQEAWKYIVRILVSILLSSILLLPTIYVLLNGRSSTNSLNYFEYLLPNINLEFLIHNSYGIGLTSIGILALLYALCSKRKEEKTIGIFLTIIISIPLFNLLLNGGLYLNGKAFIPLLPLFVFLIVTLLDNITIKDFHWKYLLLILIASLLFTKNTTLLVFLIDLLITIPFLYWYSKSKKYIFLTPIVILALLSSFHINSTDKLIPLKKYDEVKKLTNANYEEYIEKDSIYRLENYSNQEYFVNYSKGTSDYITSLYSSTSNPYYKNAYYNTFINNDIYRNEFILAEQNNLFFLHFMGVKYIIGDDNIPYGYYPVQDFDKATLYQNDNVHSIGFATNHILSNEEYDALIYNEQVESFQNNIIIDGASSNPNKTFISKKVEVDYKIKQLENIEYEKKENSIQIKANKKAKVVLNLNEPLEDNTLLVRFTIKEALSCRDGDIKISINGIANKLTCSSWKYYNHNETFDYVLSSNEAIKELVIEFSKGEYEILNMETYSIPNTYFDSLQDNKDFITMKQIDADTLLGDINVSNDGYFLLTIPYDEYFTITVDDSVVSYELANKAFIAFPIEKGKHTIKIQYQAPYFKLGKCISLTTFVVLILLNLKKKLS